MSKKRTDSEELCELLQSRYAEITQKSMDKKQAQELISGLGYLRGVSDDLADYPGDFFRHLFAKSDSRQLASPCDVIDVRCILRHKMLRSTRPMPLFPIAFAKKYLGKYSALIVVNKELLEKPCEIFGDVYVYFTGTVDITEALESIVVQKFGNRQSTTINEIVKEVDPAVSVFNENYVSQLQTRHFAQSKSNQIQVNSQEKAVFDLLEDVVKKFNLRTTIRVAGGWVRDKILGQQNKDIDLTLDNMTGAEFAQRLIQYREQFLGGDKEKISDNFVAANELKTAGIRILGVPLDFVHLRGEEYGTGTNKPKVTFEPVSLEIDAQRRDLTINSLYYNLSIHQVEDPTGSGINDLQGNINLRAPQEPLQMLLDDPLRALRVLRFYSRYDGATLDEGLQAALANPQVHQAYKVKVTDIEPGRAKEEFLKMMSGNRPGDAIGILVRSGLADAVFDIPSTKNLNPFEMDQQNENHALNVLDHTVEVINNLNRLLKEKGVINKKTVALMNLSALFHDFGKRSPGIQTPHPKKPGSMQYIGHEDVSKDIASEALKHIGFDKQDRGFVASVVGSHMKPHQSRDWRRSGIGSFVRDSRENLGGNNVDPDVAERVSMIPDLIFYHAMADSMSKGKEDPGLAAELAERENTLQQVRNYQEETPTKQVRINGKGIGSIVMDMIPPSEIDSKTGYIKDVTAYLLPLIDNQELDPNNEEAIRAAILVWKKENITKYQKDNTMPNTQASNWFRRVKFAATGSPNTSHTNEYDGYEGQDNPADAGNEITFMQHSVGSGYRKGDHVVSRHNQNLRGRVKKIEGIKMTIQWGDSSDDDKSFEQDFDLTHPEQMQMAFQRLTLPVEQSPTG